MLMFLMCVGIMLIREPPYWLIQCWIGGMLGALTAALILDAREGYGK
jgi:hypothetical protein